MAKPKGPKKGKPSSSKSEKKNIKDEKTTVKKVTQKLPCKLTEREIAKAGKALASTMASIDKLEEQKKLSADRFKADIGLLEEAVTKLRTMLDTGEEERNVECEITTDYRGGEVRTKRLDTGDVYQKRNLTAEEAQLPLEPKKEPAKLLAFDGGKNAAGDEKPAKRVNRRKPEALDEIVVETKEGWKKGFVKVIYGKIMHVEMPGGKIEQVPIEGDGWRWPEDSEGDAEKAPPLTATVGELDAANKAKAAKKDAADAEAPEGDE